MRHCQKIGIPPILHESQIANQCGVSDEILKLIVKNPVQNYRIFKVRKRNGGSRSICAPLAALLGIQRYISKNILSAYLDHPSSHAYCSGRSIVSFVKPHVHSRDVLKLDIENFFDSIRFYQVYPIFYGLGFSKSVSTFLTSVCTLNSSLPQGGATSPKLSNIFMYPVDEYFSLFAK